MDAVVSYHTSPQQGAELARDVAARAVLLTHVVPPNGKNITVDVRFTLRPLVMYQGGEALLWVARDCDERLHLRCFVFAMLSYPLRPVCLDRNGSMTSS